MTALSILDLALLNEGSTPREALQRSLQLAQQAENGVIGGSGWPSIITTR